MDHTKDFNLLDLIRMTDEYLDNLEQLNKAYPVFDRFIHQLRSIKTCFLDIQIQRGDD